MPTALAAAAAASHEGLLFLPTKVAGAPWVALLPALPLLAALLLGPLGPLLSRRIGAVRLRQVGIGIAAITLVFVLLATLLLAAQPPATRALVATPWTVLDVGVLRIDFALLLDPLAAVFALATAAAGLLAQLHRPGLALDETRALRQSAWAHAFVGSMLLLELADDAAILLAGWQAAALCGWGLLGRRSAPVGGIQHAMKAFVMNRLGDVGLLAAGALLFWSLGATGWGADGRIEKDVPLARLRGGAAAFEVGSRRASPVPIGIAESMALGDRKALGASWIVPGPTTSLRQLRDAVAVESTGVREHLSSLHLRKQSLLLIVCLSLLLAAATRSALVPLHVWQPDAVARALPASALLLSAALPLGGVYLVARLAYLFAAAPGALLAVGIVGALSAAFSGMVALARRDLQKLLGQIAVAQFGLAFLALGAGAFDFAVAHALVTGALEALLWIAAGTLVRHSDQEQDMRRLGLHASPPRAVWLAFASGCALLVLWPVVAAFGSAPDALSAVLAAPQLEPMRWVLFAAAWIALVATSAAAWRAFGFAFAGRTRPQSFEVDRVIQGLLVSAVLVVLTAIAGWSTGVLPAWLDEWFAPAWRVGPQALPQSSAIAACALAAALAGWVVARALTWPGEAARRTEAALGSVFVWIDRFVLDGTFTLVAGFVQFSANLVSALDRFLLDGVWRLLVAGVLRLTRRAPKAIEKPSAGGAHGR